jgi:1,4-dihydroxy-2-naphthoyl-CoA hydrolase
MLRAYSSRMPIMSIWQKPFDLDALNARSVGTLNGHLGIRITAFGEDWISGELPVDARTRQPFGLLHGGASVVLAETLGSMGGWLCLPDDGSRTVGLEINANHLRAVRAGVVTGTARPVHLGRTTQVWEIRMVDGDERPSCISRLTLAIVRD